ncbi:hypothetical protein [Demequina sp.]|uniref:hypothetical protein n=1 Tax=Demequina sp. TaxID=2050685 RepID=UPI003A8936A1
MASTSTDKPRKRTGRASQGVRRSVPLGVLALCLLLAAGAAAIGIWNLSVAERTGERTADLVEQIDVLEGEIDDLNAR